MINNSVSVIAWQCRVNAHSLFLQNNGFSKFSEALLRSQTLLVWSNWGKNAINETGGKPTYLKTVLQYPKGGNL